MQRDDRYKDEIEAELREMLIDYELGLDQNDRQRRVILNWLLENEVGTKHRPFRGLACGTDENGNWHCWPFDA